ncbi:MAG: response regulator transcription factor [Lunatimonas sp.]|nr:response regulator transcription factor [Lunatimonas sp.]
MKIAIVDDERHCIESLELDFESLSTPVEIIFSSPNPKIALAEIPKLPIDILFLDVEMPFLNGFELLDQIDPISFDVVFVTAHSEYALEAFKNKAFQFLLKPVDLDDLEEILSDWTEKNASTQYLINGVVAKQLVKLIKNEGLIKNKIAVPVSDGFEFLETDQIEYCESDSNYTRIFLSNGTHVLISKTLKEVERTLTSFLFLRIHQRYLINPNYLRRFRKTDGGFVEMKGGALLPVGKTKRGLLTEFFEIVSRG